jgi:hypothetical protein
MYISVWQGKAYKVTDINGNIKGFLYYYEDKALANRVVASSIWAENVVPLLLLLLKASIGKYQYMLMVPHGDNFKMFKSLATKSSLRRYNSGTYPHIIIKQTRHLRRYMLKAYKLFRIRRSKWEG